MTRTIAQIETLGGKDELRRDDYFPTLVFSTFVHDAEEMNKEILEAINYERDRDTKGIERSNYRSLGGWHSHNNLHKDKKFDRLTDRLHQMAAGISDNLGYAKNRRLEITTMWSISNPPGASNRSHIHPGAIWSGVYYVQAPEGAGQIELVDPRTVNLMNSATFTQHAKRKTECWTKVKVKPVAGKMLFFPAWLYHGIDPNLATGEGRDSERVVIAFNINQKLIPKKA
jgi:uncharacterized protein (TIGR02466 family)